MSQYLPIILASGLLAFLTTPLTRFLARRWGMIDQPGLRKAHRSPIPLLGGLAIYSAFALSFLYFGLATWVQEGAGILGGATLLFLTGLWDDRFGMPARLKLLAQIVAAGVLIATGVQVHLLGSWWLDWPLTLFWVVGITNAVNLMDNMDGLAAGISATAAVFFLVMAALEGQGLVASLAAALLGAAAGFLFYNFAPAVSFMGDAGALTLGFMLAVLGIKIEFPHLPLGSTWMAPIVVLGVLIFDTTLVSISRVRRGRSIFQGGSDHTSHRLVQLGLGAPRAVLTLYAVAGGLGALALTMTRSPIWQANLIFGLLLVVGAVLLMAFERVEPKLTGEPPVVLIPGGGNLAEAIRSAQIVSRNLTVLLAPRRLDGQVVPTRAEVIDVVALLAEDPAAVRPLLERGLGDAWWRELDALQRALRLTGVVAAVWPEPLESLPAPHTVSVEGAPAVLTTLRKAKLVMLGPGPAEINLMPVLAAPGIRAAVTAVALRCLPVDTTLPAEWLVVPATVTPLASFPARAQALLLGQAAAQAKTDHG